MSEYNFEEKMDPINFNLQALDYNFEEGLFTLFGWAYSEKFDIERIEVLINDEVQLQITYPIDLPELAEVLDKPRTTALAFHGVTDLVHVKGVDFRLRAEVYHQGASSTLFELNLKGPVSSYLPMTQDQLADLIVYKDVTPLFIVGLGRSGSTMMQKALTGIFECQDTYIEGYQFGVMHEVLSAYLSTKRLWSRHLEQELFSFNNVDGRKPSEFEIICTSEISIINGIISSFVAEKKARVADTVWIDKTPGPKGMSVIPLISKVFPRAKFIFLHRHPLAIIKSSQKKFQNMHFSAIMDQWAWCMTEWSKVKKDLPDSMRLDVPYSLIAERDAVFFEQLGEFLGLNTEKTRSLLETFKTSSVEKTRSSDADWDITLDDMSFSDEDKALFVERYSDLAAKWQYGI